MNGCLVGFLKVLLFGFLFFWWIIFAVACIPFLTGLCYISAILLCVAIFRSLKKKQQTQYQSFPENLLDAQAFSEKQLATACLADCLRTCSKNSRRPVARKTIKLRAIYTVIFLVLHFFIWHFCYYQPAAVLRSSCLMVIYTILFYHANTLSVLARMAKKQPYTDFDVLIRDNTFNEFETPVCKKLSYLGVAAFLVSLICVFTLHNTAKWEYQVVDGGYAVVKYQPAFLPETDIEIPDQYNGAPVVAIGEKAFYKHTYLKTASIPDSVLHIEQQAFSGCSNLESIQLSDRLLRIGVGAFSGCSFLNTVELPATLTELLAESFSGCRDLESIQIPAGVTEIRANAFEDCSKLKSVILHDGIIDIHAYAFRNCNALEQIDLPGGITEIHAYTFENCSSLKSITIPNGVTRIAAHAFYGCSNLAYVNIPLSVTEIRSSAFRECDSLKEVSVAQDTVIDERAFKDSPTKIYRNPLTSEQWSRVIEEISEKDFTDFYYVVNEQTNQAMLLDSNSTLFVTDNDAYSFQLESGFHLQQFPDTAAFVEYLETAQSLGVSSVQLCTRSTLGTQWAGEDFFVYITNDISDVIAEYKTEVSNNG